MITIKFRKKFWDEKVQWKENGDLTNHEEIVARVNGMHYVIDAKDAFGVVN